jgi:hypothetical protein
MLDPGAHTCNAGSTGHFMYPRLTRGEYWLLETVVELGVDLSALTKPHLGESLNKQPHGLSRDQLLADLSRLFAEKLIVAKTADDRPFTPTPGQIVEALDRTSDDMMRGTWYFLTPKGGAVWEAFAHPEWTRYVEIYPSSDDNCLTEFRCLSLPYLQCFFHAMELQGPGTGPDTKKQLVLEWDQLEPWDATYWKRFPRAHRLRAWVPEDAYWFSGWEVCMLQRSWYPWQG